MPCAAATVTPLIFDNPADEAEALARQCPDYLLPFAGVADGGPGRIETGRQCGIRDNAAVPDCADDVVFADHAFPIADQVVKQVEHLWCESDQLGASTQFAPVRVKCVFFKVIAQSATSSMPRDVREALQRPTAKHKPPVSKM